MMRCYRNKSSYSLEFTINVILSSIVFCCAFITYSTSSEAAKGALHTISKKGDIYLQYSNYEEPKDIYDNFETENIGHIFTKYDALELDKAHISYEENKAKSNEILDRIQASSESDEGAPGIHNEDNSSSDEIEETSVQSTVSPRGTENRYSSESVHSPNNSVPDLEHWDKGREADESEEIREGVIREGDYYYPTTIPTLAPLPVPEIKDDRTCCEKGERGQRGRRGFPGDPGGPGLAGRPGLSIEGSKGEKGEPCLFDYPAWVAGNKKEAQHKQKDDPTYSKTSKPDSIVETEQVKRNYEIVPGAIVFKNRDSMLLMTEYSRTGTVIYIIDEEKYFGRVAAGWREIMMGGDTITLPFDHSKILNEGNAKTKEADWVGRRRRTSNKRTKVKPHLRIAALNDPWNGDLHGSRGADYKCANEAKRANINGTFRAFLSYDSSSMEELVASTDRNLPVFNLRGDFLFRTWNDMFVKSGMLTKTPLIYSFNGSNVLSDIHWPVKRIWHGGKFNDASVGKLPNCRSWNSDRFYNEGLASDLLLKGKLLLSQQKIDCRQNLIVLCIETARTAKSDYH